MREFLLYYGIFAIYYVVTINSLYFIIMMFSFKNIMGILKNSVYSRFQALSGSKHVPPHLDPGSGLQRRADDH